MNRLEGVRGVRGRTKVLAAVAVGAAAVGLVGACTPKPRDVVVNTQISATCVSHGNKFEPNITTKIEGTTRVDQPYTLSLGNQPVTLIVNMREQTMYQTSLDPLGQDQLHRRKADKDAEGLSFIEYTMAQTVNNQRVDLVYKVTAPKVKDTAVTVDVFCEAQPAK